MAADAVIEQCVQSHRRLGRAERRPREYRQTKIDGGGAQDMDRVGQTDTIWLVDIKLADNVDETLGEAGMDAPVAHRIGVDQRAAGGRSAKAHVIEFGAPAEAKKSTRVVSPS